MSKGSAVASGKKSSERSLAVLLDDGEYDYNYHGARLPLGIINVLPQPRKTFTNIDVLAGDIALRKLLHPMIVAEFDLKYLKRYLRTIRLIWGIIFPLSRMRPTETKKGVRYYVLLAGERRYRSFAYLSTVGCEPCRDGTDSLPDGRCLRKHFPRGVDVRLCRNIPPLQAVYRQLAENTHEAVPPHQEAVAIGETFVLARQVKPDMTPGALAREIGMKEHKVRSAVLFHSLPDSIKIVTGEKTGKLPTGEQTISYGIALQLARLYEDGETEEELHRWATRAMVHGVRRQVAEFKELVDAYLENKHSGQIGLFDAAENARLAARNYREVVGRNVILSFHVVMQYLSIVEAHFENGTLGAPDSPFSILSPVRTMRKLLAHFERVIVHIRRFLPSQERARATVVTSELVEALAVQEDMLVAQEKIAQALSGLSDEDRETACGHIAQLVEILSVRELVPV